MSFEKFTVEDIFATTTFLITLAVLIKQWCDTHRFASMMPWAFIWLGLVLWYIASRLRGHRR